MEQNNRILVVEDDAGIRRSLFETLGALGFSVGEAHNGEEAQQRLRMVTYNAVLLDINMPGMGGIETCRRISQQHPGVPIIMLTVRDEEDDIVEALDAGASDFVTKPFQIRELTARIRAVVRRQNAPLATTEPLTVVGEISLDADRRRVEKRGEQIHLAPKEFETLRYLMQHAGRPVRHERLLAAVWGPLYGTEREYLRVIVNQLRKKIEDDPSHPAYILTESHIGYRFRPTIDEKEEQVVK
jgi:two-component system KDP operon response regulator KdpE